jgi:hypothetical protein
VKFHHTGKSSQPGGVWAELRQTPGQLLSDSRRLSVEFNPQHATEPEWEFVGGLLDLYGCSLDRLTVDRLDIAWDLFTDPYSIHLDSPRRKLDHEGITARGPQSIYLGSRNAKGNDTLIRYDKSAEQRAKGREPAHDPWCRVEARGAERDDTGDAITLSKLHRWPCPLRETDRVVQMVRNPEDFADDHAMWAACVFRMMGPRAGRKFCAELLGRGSADQIEFCMDHDLTPWMRRAYRECWPESASLIVDQFASAVGAAAL